MKVAQYKELFENRKLKYKLKDLINDVWSKSSFKKKSVYLNNVIDFITEQDFEKNPNLQMNDFTSKFGKLYSSILNDEFEYYEYNSLYHYFAPMILNGFYNTTNIDNILLDQTIETSSIDTLDFDDYSFSSWDTLFDTIFQVSIL